MQMVVSKGCIPTWLQPCLSLDIFCSFVFPRILVALAEFV